MGDSVAGFHIGMKIICPHCGQSSLVKQATRMDGWTVCGQIFSCALCTAELAPVAEADSPIASQRHPLSLDRLSAALSQAPPINIDAKAALAVDDETTRFCKDCLHFFRHPFADKCLLHRRLTNPMDDCPQFARKPEDSS